MCIIISISMGIFLNNKMITEMITSIIISWCINMGFDLIFPVGKIADFLSKKINSGKRIKYLVKVLIVSLLNVTFILAVMLLMKVGINNTFLLLMRKTWLPLIVIAYIGAIILTPISTSLSEFVKSRICIKK